MIFIVYFIYLILSGILLFILTKGHLMDWLFKFVVIAFLPIIGWLLPSIWPKKWLKQDAQFFEDYMNSQSEDLSVRFLERQEKVQKNEELNIISIEEALLISDFSTRRRVLIDILKQDAMQYIDVLKTAVTNEDTETSHYAVTAVVEVKRELTILLQKLAVEFAQNPEDSQVALTYAEVIKEYIRSGFLDARSIRQYQIKYIELLEHLIRANEATENTYIEKIKMELTVQDLASAEATVQQFKTDYPLCEDAYLQAMSIYFVARAFDKLQDELALLKAAPITLSNRALKIVRYWNGVSDNHEITT